MVTLTIQTVDFICQIALGNIYLTADNRFDSVCFGGFIKIHRTEHVAVVGDGKCRLPQILCNSTKLPEAASAVEEAVFGMQM